MQWHGRSNASADLTGSGWSTAGRGEHVGCTSDAAGMPHKLLSGPEVRGRTCREEGVVGRSGLRRRSGLGEIGRRVGGVGRQGRRAGRAAGDGHGHERQGRCSAGAEERKIRIEGRGNKKGRKINGEGKNEKGRKMTGKEKEIKRKEKRKEINKGILDI